MLSSDIVSRILKANDALGLQMQVNNNPRIIYWKVKTAEMPDDLANFSLGSATAFDTDGTGWIEINDSNTRYYLEPEFENIIYQFYFGVAPAQAQIYRRYPSNRDINSLIGTRAVGSGIGFIDGHKSPYRHPTVISEMFSLKGSHPSFLGYHPYGEPSSITVRLYFYIVRYNVVFKGVEPFDDASDAAFQIAPEEFRERAVVRPIGGQQVIDAPNWVQNTIKV